jgi:hypothetical protein
MDQPIASRHPERDVTAGLILIFASLASLTAVTHHPVIKARSKDEFFAQIQQTAFSDRLVHGGLMLCSILLLLAFCRFAQRQGTQRTPILLGLIFYALGTGTLILAAMTDGFFVPAVGMAYLHATSADTDIALALIRFCSIAIQLFTRTSIIATSIAILLWSISLMRAGRGAMLAAVIGFLAVVAQFGILIYGHKIITAHTIMFVVVAQMIWYFVVGVLLTKGQL